MRRPVLFLLGAGAVTVAAVVMLFRRVLEKKAKGAAESSSHESRTDSPNEVSAQ